MHTAAVLCTGKELDRISDNHLAAFEVSPYSQIRLLLKQGSGQPCAAKQQQLENLAKLYSTARAAEMCWLLARDQAGFCDCAAGYQPSICRGH